MKKVVARLLGALLALLLAAGFVAYRRLRPPPCTGGVYIELRPPLPEPGRYRFRVELDGGERLCEFDAAADGSAKKLDCKMPLELATRVQENAHSIVGLTIGAAPERLRLQVKQGNQAIYDSELSPKYTPWAIRREDSKHFCGDRALLQPQCLRGSPQCAPYPARCDGPEDCPTGQVCCASAEWAREYGVYAATECSSQRNCLDRFARIACHADADCPSGAPCNDATLRGEFAPPLTACAAK